MMRQQPSPTRAPVHPHTRLKLESGQHADNKQVVFLFPRPEILFLKGLLNVNQQITGHFTTLNKCNIH